MHLIISSFSMNFKNFFINCGIQYKFLIFNDLLKKIDKNYLKSCKILFLVNINDYENMKLIYILKILFEENTYYKVGMTNNILSRVTGLYEIYGFFEILYLMKTENNIEVES